MNEKAPLSYIRELTNKNYQIHSSSAQRGRTTREIPDYLDYLPTMKGKNFVDFLDERILDSGHSSVLDIGCGQAHVLSELKKKYSDKLSATGITAYDYREKSIEGINYVIGDAHQLQSHLKGQSFDAIISVYALQHMQDPLRVIKSAYRLLKKGGRGYFHFSPLVPPLLQGEPFKLERYWQERGIQAEIDRDGHACMYGSVVIQKDEVSNLPMPFIYTANRDSFSSHRPLDYKLTL